MYENVILGAGPTGLGLGMTTGWPILEAQSKPGGICRSYFIDREGGLAESPEVAGGDVYRFEHGGGHWLFHLDERSIRLLEEFVTLEFHTRDSAVYFPDIDTLVPYPLQDHLDSLPSSVRPLAPHSPQGSRPPVVTMQDWLQDRFGPELCSLFFFPFHDLYTCGLYSRIAPQDAFKTPKSGEAHGGYNTRFAYPREGLDGLFQRLAARCNVSYSSKVVRIDTAARSLLLSDGRQLPYTSVYSTLPLSTMMQLTGLNLPAHEDPHISVHVANIGAVKGPRCPGYHWLYVPESASGFHRVGFYSNVSDTFLPQSVREAHSHVSLYVERCCLGESHLTEHQVADYLGKVIAELQQWGFIGTVEVCDSSWVDIGYTWSWPGSTWREDAVARLHEANIRQLGRYGRWAFQGIVDSLQEGMACGQEMNS